MKTKVRFVLLVSSCCLALAALVMSGSNPRPAPVHRDTVNKGLEYLVRNQHKDGHWEGAGGQHPVAMTGLAGLALLMEGSNAKEGKYSVNIRKAVDWLQDKSQAGRDGLIFSEHPSETARYMQGHGLATLFLAGAYKGMHDPPLVEKLTPVLTRAVKYIAKAQSSQGGWYHTSKVEGHDFDVISVTVIQIQALQAAENARRIAIPHQAISDGLKYLEKAMEKYDTADGPERNRDRPADIAAVLACRFRHEGLVARDELSKKWLKDSRSEIAVGRDVKFGRDELVHYYYAQAVFNLGDDWAELFNVPLDAESVTWSRYRTAVFDHLQNSQNQDGSWPGTLASQEGLGVGPVCSTALWCIVLQIDTRHHPSYELRMMKRGRFR